jgi:hypothetical protein
MTICHEPRDIDPGIVRTETGRPDHNPDVESTPVGKPNRPALRLGEAWLEFHARSPELASARPNHEISASLHAAPQPRVCWPRLKAESREPPEEILPKQSLRKHRRTRSYRHVDGVRRDHLLCDLQPGVAATDDEHRTVRQGGRVAIGGGVYLSY